MGVPHAVQPPSWESQYDFHDASDKSLSLPPLDGGDWETEVRRLN